MDYSASSNSSYAPSFASSNFTLSSDTTGSSTGSGNEGSRPPEDAGSANAFSAQLKRLYRLITALEAKIINDDAAENNEDVRRVLKGTHPKPVNEEAERERWSRTISDHKRYSTFSLSFAIDSQLIHHCYRQAGGYDAQLAGDLARTQRARVTSEYP
jgi:hypothetical protein